MARDWCKDGDYDYDVSYLWGAASERAFHSERGQGNLRLLEAIMLEMKAAGKGRLIYGSLCREGEVCAVGVLVRARTSPEQFSEIEKNWARLNRQEPDDWEYLEFTAQEAKGIGLQKTIACEMSIENDAGGRNETPEQRFERMLAWVQSKLIEWDPVTV